MRQSSLAVVVACALLALGACEKKGPVEQFGEEVDEAVDTAKRGGEESTSNKVDDAADEMREGAENAKEEIGSN